MWSSNNEASVQAFDLMLADRYASDGQETHRTVRERKDTPPPKVDPGHHHTDGADADGTDGTNDPYPLYRPRRYSLRPL